MQSTTGADQMTDVAKVDGVAVDAQREVPVDLFAENSKHFQVPSVPIQL